MCLLAPLNVALVQATVRGYFYALVSFGVVPNRPKFYNKLVDILSEARYRGDFDFDAVAEGGRKSLTSPDFDETLEEALKSTAEYYTRDLWADKPVFLTFLIEKTAIAGLLTDVTRKYGVTLRSFSGSPSLTLVEELAEEIAGKLNAGKEVRFFYLGDFDPSGFFSIEFPFLESLASIADRFYSVDLTTSKFFYERLGLLPGDFAKHNLVKVPLKSGDNNIPRYVREFGLRYGAEIDALGPRELRKRVEDAILRFLPRKEYERLNRGLEAERESAVEVLSKLKFKKETL